MTESGSSVNAASALNQWVILWALPWLLIFLSFLGNLDPVVLKINDNRFHFPNFFILNRKVDPTWPGTESLHLPDLRGCSELWAQWPQGHLWVGIVITLKSRHRNYKAHSIFSFLTLRWAPHTEGGFSIPRFVYANHSTSKSSEPKAVLAAVALEASAQDSLTPSLGYRVSLRLARDPVQKPFSIKPTNHRNKFKNPNKQRQT